MSAPLSRLKTIGERFKMRFTRIDGFQFFGQMLDIPDTARVSNFFSARRYLRVATECEIKPSDVVIINKVKYIIGEHGDGFYHEPIYRFFKLFAVDLQANYYASIQAKNAITGVWERHFDTVPTTIYLSTQPESQVEDSIGIPQQRLLALCNHPAVKDDKIGNYIVTKVDFQLGIYVVELKEI